MERVSELTAHTGFWMRFVSNHVSLAFAKKIANEDVTVAEWVMLRSLYDKDSQGPSRLAHAMGMTKGAITKLAERLIVKAMVVRKANPDDGRAQSLSLTAKGAKLVPKLAKLADQNDREFFDVLTKLEREALERLLKKLVERGAMTSVPTD